MTISKEKDSKTSLTKNSMKIGEIAPSLSLQNQFNETVNLSDYIGKSRLVIFFYPKDNTAGCTKEACAFRDYQKDFKELNCQIIGISSDNAEKHLEFAEKNNLDYPLLADIKQEARKLFGVPKSLFGLIPGRVTYVIDEKGVIIDIFNSQLQFTDHISNAIEAIKKL